MWGRLEGKEEAGRWLEAGKWGRGKAGKWGRGINSSLGELEPESKGEEGVAGSWWQRWSAVQSRGSLGQRAGLGIV